MKQNVYNCETAFDIVFKIVHLKIKIVNQKMEDCV